MKLINVSTRYKKRFWSRYRYRYQDLCNFWYLVKDLFNENSKQVIETHYFYEDDLVSFRRNRIYSIYIILLDNLDGVFFNGPQR